MKYVVEVPTGKERQSIAWITQGKTQVFPLQSLPEYVSKIALENTALTETVAEQKAFVQDLCHTLGMSLESTTGDLLNRIRSIRDNSEESLLGEIQKQLRPTWTSKPTKQLMLNVIAEDAKQGWYARKARQLIENLVVELVENGMVDNEE